MPDFLGIERLSYGPWQAFERSIQRLLIHAGFADVRLVGGSGDAGADIVAERNGDIWVIQAKYRSKGQLLGPAVIDEITTAVDRYDANIAVVAVTTGWSQDAPVYAMKRRADLGIPIFLWDGPNLLTRARKLPLYAEDRHQPRPYQSDAIAAVNECVSQGETRALVLMATGLGKSRVAAGVIERWITDRPHSEVLILVPTLELVPQFEASLWPYLPKTVSTHILTGTEKPAFTGGVTIATYQSAARRNDFPNRFGLVIVDEAHHAPADGYAQLIGDLGSQFLLGLTATPWRGDDRQLEDVFGRVAYSLNIVEGMQKGYLADVDYRMLVDSLNWDWISSELPEKITIRDLNRRLFIPELEEAVIGKIRKHLEEIDDPRCVIFCKSIQHANRVGTQLHAEGWPTRVVHSQLDRFDTTRAIREFRSGTVPIVVAVDILNEGIDIPAVNLVVFSRVTHSRRIFVQQLGRGLRLSEGKTEVRVLDFVSDIRRIAAALNINRQAVAVTEDGLLEDPYLYPTGEIVKFEGDEDLDFFLQYISDVAELEDTDETSQLSFPDPYVRKVVQ